MDSNSSYEPMDVDLSAQSNNEMDVSFEDSIDEVVKNIKKEKIEPESLPKAGTANISTWTTPPQATSVKKFHINLQKENKTSSPLYTRIIITSLFILAVSIVCRILFNVQCIESLDLDMLNKNFSSKLFGQENAVHDLLQALSALDRSKIIFLYGGTGVGKTYTSTILMEQTKDYINVNHYTMPSFGVSFTTNIMLDIYICKNSIIIVDDITLKDENINTHIDNLLTKSKNMGKNVTIILIYNCQNSGDEIKCDDSFIKRLNEQFKEIIAYKKFIKYEKLNLEHLRMCMESELKKKVNDDEFHKFAKNFDVSVDGCKGVHTKMKLIESSHN